MGLLDKRDFYKPFNYGWAHKLWREHESVHWMGYEVPLHEDVRDWNTKLTDKEKALLTHLFRFFTQADVSVAGGYCTKFIPYFAHKPELAMMLSSFAAREAIHIDAYALLLETLGMPETTYSEFQSYKEMKDKNDFVNDFNTKDLYEVAKSLAVYSAFTEGVQLFGSFAVLLNFSRFNKMKNMGNIIAWSVRDEAMHVEGMTNLFKILINEYADLPMKTVVKDEGGQFITWRGYENLSKEIPEIAKKMVDIEDHFIDLLFSGGEMEGLTSQEVKLYIRYLTNQRYKQLGFKGDIYSDIEKNPLPWIDVMVYGEEHSNFFESKSTFYSKASTQGSMEEIKW